MAKRRAVVVGFDYYAHFLANLVNERSQHWQLRAYDGSRVGTLRALFAMRGASALISFGGPAPNTALVEAARRRNIPVIVIWAGSDLIKAQRNPHELEVDKQENFYHISDGPWLVDELKTLGITADYEPVTAVDDGGPVKPFPREFRVLTYLPEPRRDFYGAQTVYAAARAMPDVRFDVVGAGGRSPDAPPNVSFHGVVRDMPRRLDECVALLRQPEHDGKSMLVLEALARARHVVWNYQFPHVHNARGIDQVLETLGDLRRRHQNGGLALNNEGCAFALNSFARRDIAARFERRLDDVVHRQAAVAGRPTYRVAISGLGLFCAHVAEQARTAAPDWDVRLLRTRSRLEVFTSIITLLRCDLWYTIGDAMPDRWLALAARLLGKPRVVHWVGSDITKLTEQPKLRDALTSPRVLHLAEVTWIANESGRSESYRASRRFPRASTRARARCCRRLLRSCFTSR